MFNNNNLPFKIIDDFLPTPYWTRINYFLCSPEFPWYYQDNIVNTDQPSAPGCFGFNYWVFHPGETMCRHNWSHSIQEAILPFALSVQQAIGFKNQISRVRCDMTMYNPNQHMHEPHIDVNEPHVAAVYYVNDSDGNTVLYKQRSEVNDRSKFPEQLDVLIEVEPKANRLLMFDGSLIHTGHSPSKTNSRVIINSDYII